MQIVPDRVLLGKDNSLRLVHDSGIVVLIKPVGIPTLEYYQGGVKDDVKLGWDMVEISRAPTLTEVGLFRAICQQAGIALSLI